MKELVKPVLKDEEEEVVQALCENNIGSCGYNGSTENDDEIIF
jgi:hypothetical protein